MPVYLYKVRDRQGKVLQGQMEAADGRDLRRKLDDHQYFIIEYSEKKRALTDLNFEIRFGKSAVTLEELSIFSWQLHTMLDAGLTLTSALKILEKQVKNEHLKKTIRGVWTKVEEGNSFSEALRQYPSVFSTLFVHMVNAGEVGGVLDEMLKRLALYYERQAEIRAKLRSAMTYPIVLMVICACVVIFLLVFILPRFAGIFRSMGVSIPVVTQTLLDAGRFLREQWYVLAGMLAGAAVLVKMYIMTPAGRYKLDELKLKIPVFGDLVRKTIAAQFTQMLAILVSGGIPIMTALDVVTDSIGNRAVGKVLREVTVLVGEGKPIAVPLEESGVFPEMVVDMIRVGEESGSLDRMLEKVSHFYEREVNNAIVTFTKLIEPALIVFMTFLIGFIAFAIYMPMTQVMRGMHG